jgi:hypothetical protein
MGNKWKYFDFSGGPGEIRIDVDLPTLLAEQFAIDLKLLANKLGLTTSCVWEVGSYPFTHRPGKYGYIRLLVLKVLNSEVDWEMLREKIFSVMDKFAKEVEKRPL